mgnify:CR=1 FL=1
MKIENVFDFAYNRQTGLSSQFCPFFDNVDEAIAYAEEQVVDKVYRYNEQLEVFVGNSVEDKNIVVVKGVKGVYCVIPCAGALEGYYEVVCGKVGKNVYNRYNLNAGETKPLRSLLYSNNGILMFRGACVDETQLGQMDGINVEREGFIYDKVKCGYKPHEYVLQDKTRVYGKYKVYLPIVGQEPLHHVIYSAFANVSLDILKMLTINVADWCTWYIMADNADIVATMSLRNKGKGARWAIDHVDGDTGNNNIDNLQLCTHRANTLLSRLRRSDFKTLKNS